MINCPPEEQFNSAKMGTLILLVSLIILKLYSCAEVSTKSNSKIAALSLGDMCPELLNKIGSYLDNPYASMAFVNRYIYSVFSVDYPVKRAFNERFNIPDFVDADNDKELRRLMNYSKFTHPAHITAAFTHEFRYGDDKINALLPCLFNFLYRDSWTPRKFSQIPDIIKHKRFKVLFRPDKPDINQIHAYHFKDNYESIIYLQKYLLNNREHFSKVENYLVEISYGVFGEEANYLIDWIRAALAYDMPDMFLNRFSHRLLGFLDSPVIWTRTFVPKENYPALFDRLIVLINQKFTGSDLEYYMLLNSIRFGPEVLDIPDIYETKIRSAPFNSRQLNLLCHCASLTNRKSLFINLLNDQRTNLLANLRIIDEKTCDMPIMPIEMCKLTFDIHEYLSLGKRQQFYEQSFDVLKIFMRYCRVTSYHRATSYLWDDLTLRIEFQPPIEAIESGIPERISVINRFSSISALIDSAIRFSDLMTFSNASVYESFLVSFMMKSSYMKSWYMKSKYIDNHPRINLNNLKLIMESDHLKNVLRKGLINKPNFKSPVFIVDLELLLSVVQNEPVPSMVDIISPTPLSTAKIYKFKTKEQLSNLEILLGVSVTSLIDPDMFQYEYFMYRHIFKYIIDSGQTLPSNLPESTFKLLKIDFNY